MIPSEMIEAVKQMSNLERLEVIELASQLMRDDLNIMSQKAKDSLSLAQAAEIMRPFYEPGSELTEFTESQEIEPNQAQHPWLEFAGMYENNPLFEKVPEEIELYRHQLDIEEEKEIKTIECVIN